MIQVYANNYLGSHMTQPP